MSDVAAACSALAVAAATVTGLRGKAYSDDQINPPEAQVFNRAFDPRLTLGGSPKRMVALGLRVFVRRTDLRSAQDDLRDYMDQTGSTSILAALEDSDNWPVGTDYVEVVEIGQPFETEAAGAVYLAVDFHIDVVL